jgi:hypothetical protein
MGTPPINTLPCVGTIMPMPGAMPGSLPASMDSASAATSSAAWAAPVAAASAWPAAAAALPSAAEADESIADVAAPTAPKTAPAAPMATSAFTALGMMACSGLQCMVRSMARPARAPPMNTLLEPVATSNVGESEPHVMATPMSPARTAGRPPIKTDAQVASDTVPRLGRGTGGAGGMQLGGWRWACSGPTCMVPNVSAGSPTPFPKTAFAASAMPTLSSSPAMPTTPSTPPSAACTQPRTPWSGLGIAAAAVEELMASANMFTATAEGDDELMLGMVTSRVPG